jgi:hypothetical protein
MIQVLLFLPIILISTYAYSADQAEKTFSFAKAFSSASSYAEASSSVKTTADKSADKKATADKVAEAKSPMITIEGSITIKNEASFGISVSIKGFNVSKFHIDGAGGLTFEETQNNYHYIERNAEKSIIKYTGLHITEKPNETASHEINLALPKLIIEKNSATRDVCIIDLSAEYKYSYDMTVVIGDNRYSIRSEAESGAQRRRIEYVQEHFARLINKAEAEKDFSLAYQLELCFEKICPILRMNH